MEKGLIGEYTGNNTKLMGSPEIKYAGDVADETAQANEGSPAYRKASPLNQSMHKTLTKIDNKPAGDVVYDESNRDSRPIMKDLPHHSLERWNEYQTRGWASDETVTPYRMHMEKNLVEKKPRFMEGEMEEQRDSISRKSSSPLNESYDHKMAYDRNEINILKSAIHKDDLAKKHEGVSRKASPLNQKIKFPEPHSKPESKCKNCGSKKKK